MHLFTGFMQTLTGWLHIHPHLALLITFLVSFSESLAIIGSIVPGSLTMTAVGVLAGSGIMRIDLTLLAATLGAIAGDGASYTLGYACSERLNDIWPFRRYPNWLASGKDYFARHGRKSVLIGRFVGPLRSIIPVIAGMMRMNRLQFLVANILSAIGWALLYVMPGVLIGAASNELSAEGATKLFALILIILVMAWLTSLGIIKLIIRANIWLAKKLHIAWARLKNHSSYIWLFKLLTPKHEKNHYRTAMLNILLGICLLGSIIITLLVSQMHCISSINTSVYLFLQSVRTPFFDTFFIIITLIITPTALGVIVVLCSIYAIFYKDWRMLSYWVSLCLTCVATALLLKFFITIPMPPILFYSRIIPSFPIVNLTLATSMFSFLIFYINKHAHSISALFAQSLFGTLLPLAGLAYLYLGDNWLSSVLGSFFIGFSLSIAHWIFYRRIIHKQACKPLLVFILCALLALLTYLSYVSYFKSIVRLHHQLPQEHVLNGDAWWSQTEALLPIYITNRIGHRTGQFNIQYSGSLDTLRNTLTRQGWKSQPNTFLNSLIKRAEGQTTAKILPLVAQLHLNKKPLLNMLYVSGPKHTTYVLRLWNSHYHLLNSLQPIWIGSIVSVPESNKIESLSKTLFAPLLSTMHEFDTNIIVFKDKRTPTIITHTLLLIKENPHIPQ